MSEFSSVKSIVSNSVPPRTVYVLCINSESRKNYTCSIWYCHSLQEFVVACRFTAWERNTQAVYRLCTNSNVRKGKEIKEVHFQKPHQRHATRGTACDTTELICELYTLTLSVQTQQTQQQHDTHAGATWLHCLLQELLYILHGYNTGCFKKSFTILKAYRNLYRGHTQGFELSKCSKTHRVLPRIVMVQCDFHW